MKKHQQRFGLITTISMIVGIVVGSGIFYKSISIINVTEGNIFLGVLVFTFASLAIIFGSLTLAQLALRSDDDGGILSYTKDSYGKTASGILGWFLNFVYFPTIRCVVAWVAIIYLQNLINVSLTFEVEILLTAALLIFISIGNIISAKGSGVFQVIATITKLIPVIFVIIAGIFFSGLIDVPGLVNPTPIPAVEGGLLVGFLAALGPVSFSFDGWTISTTVAGEIKNKKRNLPLALTLSPLLILLFYIGFFIAITTLMPPVEISNHGSNYINVILEEIMGSFGAKALLFTIVISMIGTTNGVTLGDSRTMAYLGEEDLIFGSNFLKQKSKVRLIPINGIIVTTLVSLAWLFIHYLTIRFSLLQNSDISEIAIATLYLLLIFLYVKVIILAKRGVIKGFFKGYLFPILAIIGSLIIFTGSVQNEYFILYFAVTFMVMVLGYFFISNKPTLVSQSDQGKTAAQVNPTAVKRLRLVSFITCILLFGLFIALFVWLITLNQQQSELVNQVFVYTVVSLIGLVISLLALASFNNGIKNTMSKTQVTAWSIILIPVSFWVSILGLISASDVV